MKSKSTATILALLLGGIGIHRFYLNQNFLGILCLLFCWTFIPSLIALIDFIIFIFMSEESFNGKYNKQKTLQL
jgi:TM2 domain-containing membrane protein YozV